MKSTNLPLVSAVIVGGGMGTRLGANRPKAFISLQNKPLFSYSLLTFDTHSSVQETVFVVPKESQEEAQISINALKLSKPCTIVPGGKERWQSVQEGVLATKQSDWLLIHDAARPFVTHAVIDELLLKSDSFRCAITATSVSDTIRTFEKDRCLETVDRSKLLRVGTPQLFNKKDLLKAFDRAKTLETPPTDEAMLMEQSNIPIAFAWGDERNFKITTPADLALAEALASFLSKNS